MKKIIVVMLVISSNYSFSQSPEYNKSLMRDLMNSIILDEGNRDNNFYNKEDNLMYDITIKLDLIYPETKQETQQIDEMIFAQCKEDMYFYVETIFDTEMLLRLKNDCKYSRIYFNYDYKTSDYKSFRNKFYLDIQQLLGFRLNLNRKEFLTAVNYVAN